MLINILHAVNNNVNYRNRLRKPLKTIILDGNIFIILFLSYSVRIKAF